MRVPKMVKNALNSVLDVSAVFEQDRYQRKSGTIMKPTRSSNPERRTNTIFANLEKHMRASG
jgi:hypothetical protein